MRRLGKASQVLSLVVLCSLCFGTIAWADREAPRGKTPKVEASKEQRQVVLHREGHTVGKWHTTKSFTTPSPFGVNDCAGICDEEICVCIEDWWDPGCCEFGCELCWLFLE